MKQNKNMLFKRYLIFFIGLLFNSFGVGLVTKSLLGTSPIAAIPYSLSLIIPKFSLGEWTIFFSFLLIAVQIVLLKKDANKLEIFLQIIISLIFGYFIDFSMWCLKAYMPNAYFAKLLSLLAGCCVIAFGAYLEVIADVVMLPGDAFVRAIARVTNREYGGVRIVSDTSMTVIAGILCFVFLHKLEGVREGTIIAALITGNIVKLFTRQLKSFTLILLPEKTLTETNTDISSPAPFVITIAREYGSGGREIGKRLAKALGIGYYDLQIIHEAAANEGCSLDHIEQYEQKLDNPFLYNLYSWYTSAVSEQDIPKVERLFREEEKIIRKIATNESCVIIGRLSNYILRDDDNTMHIFIGADMDAKIQRVINRDGLSEEEAKKQIIKVEKERSNHCRYFTHSQWGNAKNYDITIKSNYFGVEKTVDILEKMALVRIK